VQKRNPYYVKARTYPAKKGNRNSKETRRNGAEVTGGGGSWGKRIDASFLFWASSKKRNPKSRLPLEVGG